MPAHQPLKDHHAERRTFANRTLLAFVVVIALLLVLVARLFFLQVVEHKRYVTLSDRNRMQLEPIAPTRGLIFDQKGRLLADNRPAHNLSLVREQIKDVDKTLDAVAQLIPITERDVEGFKKRLSERRRPMEPVVLRFGLSEAEQARIAVNFHRLPGVQVEADLVRSYPYANALVHALGYVGRINERELVNLDAENYSATRRIGKLGVERFYETMLHGQVGMQKVETNARGQVIRVLERTDPVPGQDLQLYLDVELQLAAERALGGQRGAVVALDPKTGGIMALVSEPGYDPNLFVTGISGAEYAALRDSDQQPLFNRAIRGQYPPASTVKMVIGLAALDTGIVTPTSTVVDPGWFQISEGGRLYRDWKQWGHGNVNLTSAIEESCDTYFYDAGFRMGIDPMSDFLNRFGFGRDTSLDLPEANAAILPSRAWKKRVRGRSWYPGDSINLSIGQGFMLATPLQLATATMVIANRGEWKNPRMLKRVISDPDYQLEVPERKLMADVKLKKSAYWDLINKAMQKVMHGSHGTARSAGEGANYRIAGKTGTAQVVGIAQDEKYDAEALDERLRDHGLFVGFAPADDPQIVVAVIVENGGGGSHAAAPVARELFDFYLLGKQTVRSPSPSGQATTEVAVRR